MTQIAKDNNKAVPLLIQKSVSTLNPYAVAVGLQGRLTVNI